LKHQQKIFINPQLNEQFHKFGFVKVFLIDSIKTEDLQTFYNQNPHNSNFEFHSTHFSKDRVYKRKIQKKIIDTFQPALKNVLSNYEVIFGNFMVKQKGENSKMPLHADWTYVDENRYLSLGIWCPLVDTNEKNGMLGVIPYSHNFNQLFRGPKIPSVFNEYNQYIIEKYGVLIPMKAGEAIIYNHKLLHFSPENTTEQERVAVNIVATPENADIFHYANIDEKIHVYNASKSNFFVEYDHFEKPECNDFKVLEVINNESINLKIIEKTLEKRDKTFKEKLIELFSF
jgi:hypothetical protein